MLDQIKVIQWYRLEFDMCFDDKLHKYVFLDNTQVIYNKQPSQKKKQSYIETQWWQPMKNISLRFLNRFLKAMKIMIFIYENRPLSAQYTDTDSTIPHSQALLVTTQ